MMIMHYDDDDDPIRIDYVRRAQEPRTLYWKLSDFPAGIHLKMDSQSALKVLDRDDLTSKLRHMETRFYYLQEQVNAGVVHPQYVPGDANPADVFTKPVKLHTFRTLIPLLESDGTPLELKL